jgi:hypothetical protein
MQVEAAAEAARRVAHPAKPCFAMGFLTGHELTWMPEALQILSDELPNIDAMISSQYSPLLANGLLNGKIVAAFLRREKGLPDSSLLSFCYLHYVGCDGLRIVPAAILRNNAVSFCRAPGVRIVVMDRCRASQSRIHNAPSGFHAIFTNE